MGATVSSAAASSVLRSSAPPAASVSVKQVQDRRGHASARSRISLHAAALAALRARSGGAATLELQSASGPRLRISASGDSALALVAAAAASYTILADATAAAALALQVSGAAESEELFSLYGGASLEILASAGARLAQSSSGGSLLVVAVSASARRRQRLSSAASLSLAATAAVRSSRSAAAGSQLSVVASASPRPIKTGAGSAALTVSAAGSLQSAGAVAGSAGLSIDFAASGRAAISASGVAAVQLAASAAPRRIVAVGASAAISVDTAAASRLLASGASSATLSQAAAASAKAIKSASGGAVLAVEASGLATGPQFAAPFAAWSHRVKLSIAAAKIESASISNMVIYIPGSQMPATFWSAVKSDGGDIRCAISDGTTEIPIDLVHLDTVGETMELHARNTETLLDGLTDSVMYVYFGNAAASAAAAAATYGKENCWQDYEMVLHMQDDPDSGAASAILDSTGNAHHGTGHSSMSGNVSGVMEGAALDFDETNDVVTVPDSAALDLPASPWAISMWLKVPNNSGPQWKYILSWAAVNTNSSLNIGIIETDSGFTDSFSNSIEDDVRLYLGRDSGTVLERTTSDQPFLSTAWIFLTLFRDSGNAVRLKLDFPDTGLSVVLASTDTVSPTGDIYIGAREDLNSLRYFGGQIDELRWGGAFGENDLHTTYNNQSAPATFFAASGLETP